MKIRKARLAAKLSLGDVARPLNRTSAWLGQVELGRIEVSADVQDRILAAIKRLAALRNEIQRSKDTLTEDLRLPVSANLIPR